MVYDPRVKIGCEFVFCPMKNGKGSLFDLACLKGLEKSLLTVLR